MAIAIRKPKEIEKMKQAGEIVACTLEYLKETIEPGMTLVQIDTLGEAKIRSLGAEPSFKGLYGFAGSVCTSLNEVCIHGVPDDKKVKEGDLLGLDIGAKVDGYFGDAAISFIVGGKGDPVDVALIECAKSALDKAIASIRVGMRFKELSAILEQAIVEKGFVPLRDYCGHGIGSRPHEEPNIPNYVEGDVKQGPKIKEGMVFCLEPMVCQQSPYPKVLEDNWSVISEDGLRTAHYEHQVAVIGGKAAVLTQCSQKDHDQ